MLVKVFVKSEQYFQGFDRVGLVLHNLAMI